MLGIITDKDLSDIKNVVNAKIVEADNKIKPLKKKGDRIWRGYSEVIATNREEEIKEAASRERDNQTVPLNEQIKQIKIEAITFIKNFMVLKLDQVAGNK